MPAFSKQRLTRYLPHALLATFLVAFAPLLVVYALERYGVLTSAFAATGVGVVLSVALARGGAWLWMRHSGSADLVFGDLMLWGWLRRLRHEKRMADAMQLLGLDRHGSRVKDVDLPAERSGEVLRELASSLEHGDPFTHGHTRRVTRYAEALAKTMRLPKDVQSKIRAAAAVHDVGKVDVPPEILNKPGRLTDEEFEIMKRHSTRGAEMVSRVGDPELTAMVRHHHERIDGRGYPAKLKGEKIPLGARVIAVADTFDAIISARPYRAARAHREAIEILKRASGTQLDEEIVQSFLSYYSGRKPLAWWLSFSAGMQRVLGGFGGWLQHAGAASVTRGATSLGATIALTTAMATVAPNLGVGRHAGPALPDRARTVVAQSDAGVDTGSPDGDAGAARAPDQVAPVAQQQDPATGTTSTAAGTDNAGSPADGGSQDTPVEVTPEVPADEVVDEVVYEEVVEDEVDDVVVDEGSDGPGNGKGHGPPDDKGQGRDKCSDDDLEIVIVAAGGNSDGDGSGPGGDHKGNGRGPCKDKDKDKDDKGKDEDDKGKDGKDDDDEEPGNGNGNGKGKDKDKDKDEDDETDEDSDGDDGDDDSESDDDDSDDSDEEGSVDAGAAVEPEPVVETESVVETQPVVETDPAPEVEVASEGSQETPEVDTAPATDGTLPGEESEEE